MAKRARSAYWMWLADKRDSIVQQYNLAGKKGSDISKKAGEVWKTMSAGDKTHYEELAVKDKVRYEEEVKTLGKPERKTKKGGEDDGGGRKKRAKKDVNAPKRPQNAYFIWLNENREKIEKDHLKGGEGFGAVSKKGGELWKAMSDAARQPYERRSEAARKQYEVDLKAYEETKVNDDEDVEDDDEDQ